MEDRVLSKQQTKTTVHEDSTSTVSHEVDKVIIGSIAAFAGVVGLWSLACLASAMFQAGGPLQLVGGWFKAVSGM
ncbi:MAG: hypothetical protein KKD01_13670 [Proteobacteria bacterium]|nr:hypothetical protein [Pseudomonadota bacterium]MBU1231643.1 hypothetical protein [Pseudomonadota bacterium]MBU1419826.1 hypothetical protein [Pseudomonadota bacterium]MBU1455768.1 hypothetical protein [Pseudomonadota bacterium]